MACKLLVGGSNLFGVTRMISKDSLTVQPTLVATADELGSNGTNCRGCNSGAIWHSASARCDAQVRKLSEVHHAPARRHRSTTALNPAPPLAGMLDCQNKVLAEMDDCSDARAALDQRDREPSPNQGLPPPRAYPECAGISR